MTLQNFSAKSIVCIDTLNGFEQPLRTSRKDSDVIIANLLVRDYPLIIHAAKS